jgi:uncharacterized membrane protein
MTYGVGTVVMAWLVGWSMGITLFEIEIRGTYYSIVLFIFMMLILYISFTSDEKKEFAKAQNQEEGK